MHHTPTTPFRLIFSTVIFVLSSFFILRFLSKQLVDNNILAPQFGEIMAVDIGLYWSAYHSILAEKTPYKNEHIFPIQKTLGNVPEDYRIIYSYPPWTTTLLAPVLSLPFPVTVFLWYSLNLVFLICTGVLLWKTYIPEKEIRINVFLVSLIAMPAISVLQYGQLGILITFALTAFQWCLLNGYPVAAGLALIPATTKPHIAYLIWPVYLIWVMKERRFRTLCSLSFGLLVLLGITMKHVPTILLDWIMNFNTQSYVRILSPTPGAILRMLDPSNQTYQFVSMMGLPLTGIVITSFVTLKNKGEFSWLVVLPLILPLSLLTTSYAMYHDQIILLIPQIMLLSLCSKETTSQRTKLEITTWLLILQSATLLIVSLLNPPQHSFWWYPLAILLIYLRGVSLLKKDGTLPISKLPCVP